MYARCCQAHAKLHQRTKTVVETYRKMWAVAYHFYVILGNRLRNAIELGRYLVAIVASILELGNDFENQQFN